MDLLEAYAHTDKALRMASITVAATMVLAHIVDLGDVVLDQAGYQLHHARVGTAGRCLLHQRLNAGPALNRIEMAGGLIGRFGIQPALQIGAAINARHMHTNRVGVGVDA